MASAPRQPDSLPFPANPAGTVNDQMPFDHIVVVMMENHSFDNLVGDLGRTRGDVNALTFDGAGHATNSNPSPAPATPITAFPVANTAQAKNVTQGWAATHEQINGGAMDGFVKAAKGQREPMGYYTPRCCRLRTRLRARSPWRIGGSRRSRVRPTRTAASCSAGQLRRPSRGNALVDRKLAQRPAEDRERRA